MMTIGMKEVCMEKVTERQTAAVIGSGTLPIYASPAMARLVEQTCQLCVAKELTGGMTTVGISLNMRHVASSPMGMTIRCESQLTEIDGRRLGFTFKVYDEVGLIGEGKHERFLVNGDAFTEKTNSKAKSV